ncbi:MAG: exonuclease [Actinomycetota bacterium]|nr:exonuclease [Actinomycetota bacterium]
MTRELYISVDVEPDGHVPGTSSIVSLGACAAALRDDDGAIVALDPDAERHSFYAVLRPITDRYVEKALRVTGFDRATLQRDGRPPAEALPGFAAWIDGLAEEHDALPVLAAYPLGFVWHFTQYYLYEYAGRSPFGQSAHLDLKSAYAALADSAVRDAIKRRMPSALLGPKDSKTHHALDDARGHVDLLLGVLRWHERTR